MASLAPNITEIICAIGAADMLVCRSSACDYPPEVVSKIPSVGGFGNPSLEALAAARPTVVLETDLADESLAPMIAQLGLHRERLPTATITDVFVSIERIGTLTGYTNEATHLVMKLKAGLDTYREAAPPLSERPRVYIEIWHDPPVTAGKGSFVSDLVAAAGGINVGDAVERDYFNVSAEWIVEQDPDIILAVYMDSGENTLQQFARRPGWSGMTAVKRGNVFPAGNSDVLLRPGPRLLEGVEILHRCLATAK
jgi:iron complex transport system substrate-binding protein